MIKALLNKIKNFHPALAPNCILGVIFSALSIIIVTTDLQKSLPQALLYIAYVCAAVFLGLAVWSVLLFFKHNSPKEKFHKLAHKRRFTGLLIDDYSFRTVTFTFYSFALNVIFTLAKGVAGWFSSSWWMISLSAYYLILCVAKFMLIKESRTIYKEENLSDREQKEWRVYRRCGFLLLFMTVVMVGIVVLIMVSGNTFTYYGTLIFVVALWDFYNLTNAIIYMVRKRRQHSPIIVAIKTIGFTTTLVSLLSLQTAMFVSFAEKSDTDFKGLMNLLTGSAVCVMLLVVGIFMVRKSGKKLKEINKTEVLE